MVFFAAGPKELKSSMKYKDITDAENYSETEISAYITYQEGFNFFGTARESQIEYNWEWKDGDDYIRLGLIKNEKGNIEIPVEMNCYISKLLKLWEILILKLRS